MTVPRLVALRAAMTALTVPEAAWAASRTFGRLEVIASADFRDLTEPGEGGRAAGIRVRVTAGHEEESEDGVSTLDRDYVRVRIESGGARTVEMATNELDVVWSESLQTASVTGAFTTATGDRIGLDLCWDGTGVVDVNQNDTSRPGRAATFVGRRRDAVATGTVTFAARTLVEGVTDAASVESLDDRIVSTDELAASAGVAGTEAAGVEWRRVHTAATDRWHTRRGGVP